MFDLEFLFVPFGRSHTIKRTLNGLGHIGHAQYYIFGIRIAKIQVTKPWE